MRIRIAYLMSVLALTGLTWLALAPVSVFDRAVLLWFREASLMLRGPVWLAVVTRDITALGSNWVLLFAMAVLALVLIMRRRVRDGLEVLLLSLGGVGLSMGAKYIFARPRPELVPHLIEVYTPSFPSGHATMSMVCFLTAALVMSRPWQHIGARRTLIVFAVLSSLLVGVSRIMLGVHWPTDVMAGWLVGGLWVLSVNQCCTHRRSDVAA